MLHEAEARGDFANLPGQGKPLPLEDMAAAGDKAMAYRLLKGNNFAPPEIELAKDIDAERARAEAKLTRLVIRVKRCARVVSRHSIMSNAPSTPQSKKPRKSTGKRCATSTAKS